MVRFVFTANLWDKGETDKLQTVKKTLLFQYLQDFPHIRKENYPSAMGIPLAKGQIYNESVNIILRLSSRPYRFLC